MDMQENRGAPENRSNAAGRAWRLASPLGVLLLIAAPAGAQSPQNMPSGSIFFEPLTPPSTPKVHPYVPPHPSPEGTSGSAAHPGDGTAGIAGSSLPPGMAPARPPAGALLGYTTDCNAVSGATASGRTSATTALDCMPLSGSGYNQR